MNYLKTDVLIIGAGAAGIRAAVSARENGADALIVALDKPGAGGTTFSDISNGWGIQALVGEERTSSALEVFYNDIVRVGMGCCREDLVRILVEESGPCVEDLISWGIEFKKDSKGKYIRSTGCFSRIQRAFLTQSPENIRHVFSSILQRRSVRVMTGYVTELIVIDGQCCGAMILDDVGHLIMINAKSVILATGGGTAVFQNHMGNIGRYADGHALAHAAGAKLNHLEFIQFALGIKQGGRSAFLPVNSPPVQEILHHKGPLILGGAFDPAAIKAALVERTQHMPFSCRSMSCLVDIIIADVIQHKESSGITYFSHAFNGGVEIDTNGESTVPGLFAAGEIATGPHGADRIGGCMLTATQVFGKRAGYFAARRAKSTPWADLHADRPKKHYGEAWKSNGKKEIFLEIETELTKTMQTYAGVIRTEKGLVECGEKINDLQRQLEEKRGCQELNYKEFVRLENMIATAKLISEFALQRRESRGSHFRRDFPPEHLEQLPICKDFS